MALSKVDKDALQRALELTLSESDLDRVAQVRSKLADDWEEAGKFCAYHQQISALRLHPWETPPCYAEAIPAKGDPSLAMLQQLLDAGLSRWEPRPVQALQAV